MSLHGAGMILPSLAFDSGAPVDFSNAVSKIRVQTKTADYTVLPSDSGTWFVTYGDTGAIVYTLPTVPTKGLHYWFFQSVDQDITISSAAADGIITFNDLDADSVIASTTSGQIGALFIVFADGNIWNAACISNGTTLTVTT